MEFVVELSIANAEKALLDFRWGRSRVYQRLWLHFCLDPWG